jgi:uncharacterized protein (DUF1330 family)
MIDEKEYEKYLESCDEVFSKYQGKYLAVDGEPTVLEGEWQYSRSVLIEFPNETLLNEWYYSSEYQNILKHRLNGAECQTIVIHGR